MEESITHKNHYIPQFYLKNWSKDDKTIYVYSLLVSNSKVLYWSQKSIKTTAVWNDFYTRYEGEREVDDFEKWFNIAFETPAKPVFEKLLRGGTLDDAESEILSRFVAAQHLRTPARLNDILARGRSVMPSHLEGVLQQTARRMEAKIPVETGDFKLLDEFKLIPFNLIIDKEKGELRANTLVGKGMYLFALKHLLTSTIKKITKHTWQVVHAAQGISFPTSDDPVICLNFMSELDYDFKGGWGRRNGNIILPISPKMLLFTQIGNKKTCTQLDYSEHWSQLFRKMIIEHAFRYVYADDHQKGMLRTNPRRVNTALFEAEKNRMSGWHEEQMQAEQEFR